MRKILFVIILITTFISCSSDSENENSIYSVWKISHIDSGDGYEEIGIPYKSTFLVFDKKGTFISKGVIGDAVGTMEIDSDNIVAYSNNEEYATFTIVNINDNKCELSMIKKSTNNKLLLKGYKTSSIE